MLSNRNAYSEAQRGLESLELEVFTVSSVYSPGAQNTNYVSFCVCTDGNDAWSLRQDRDHHLENPLTQPRRRDLITARWNRNIFGNTSQIKSIDFTRVSFSHLTVL